jgi:hypothetical protein
VLITAVLWLLPVLALSQVPSLGDADQASLPDYGEQHVLQVGAFADPANAARLQEDIRQKGFPVVIRSTTSDAGDSLTAVLAGPYADRNAAQSAKSALETHGWPGFLRTEQILVQEHSAEQILAQEHSAEQVPAQEPYGNGRAPLAPGAGVGGNQVNLAQDQAQLFAQAERELFEVPPVIERPLGMEEGPRVVVRAFDLSGAVDREKQDLFVNEIEAILAGRIALQSPDGYTINQLQGVADEVTRFYRERGFVIAQAIIPAQEVENGVVSLRVLEGSLGNVRVEDNNAYKSSIIEGPFRRLQGYPITQDSIERALLDVQNFPGLTVFGTFTQGDELGNTDLIVKVREEDRFNFTPSVDNYGSEFTGEFRAMLDFKFNNLFGVADQLNGYVLKTFEPDNGTYGGLNFQFPFGRNAIGFGASTNQFDVGGLEGLTELGVAGTVDQADIHLDRTFANGRFFGASARLGKSYIERRQSGRCEFGIRFFCCQSEGAWIYGRID